MSRGRIPTHQQRQQPWRRQQQQRPALLRSQRLLTERVRAQAQELTGPQLRDMVTGPDLMLPYATRQKANQQFAEDFKDVLDAFLPRAVENMASLLRRDPAKEARKAHVATGLGLLRDADGNVIQLDARDRPYVVVSGGEILYIKVFKARITLKGVQLDAQCTAENPDGTREVLLVEPLPMLHPPPVTPF